MLALALFSPLLVAPAEAGPVFTEASAEVYLDDNGNWPRAYPYNDGWMVFHAGGGDYQLTHAHADLSPDRTDVRALTGRTDLKDHDVRPCPDGTFLHVATADFVPQGHDSAYSWRYDADATH